MLKEFQASFPVVPYHDRCRFSSVHSKGETMSSNHKSGFSLVELLVVLSIIGILLAMLVPATRSTRSAARRTECANNLRQIGIAIHNYSDACKQLPMAALSYRGTQPESVWVTTGSPNYWLANQWTSTLAQVMPYMELNSLSQNVDPIFFAYDKNLVSNSTPSNFLEIQGYWDLVYTKIPQLTCPSDDANEEYTRAVITVLPSYHSDLSNPNDDTAPYCYINGWSDSDFYQNTAVPGRANYVACAGVNFGAGNRKGDSKLYRGMLGLREKRTLEEISNCDGTSATLLMGESLGEVQEARYLPRNASSLRSHKRNSRSPATSDMVPRLLRTRAWWGSLASRTSDRFIGGRTGYDDRKFSLCRYSGV